MIYMLILHYSLRSVNPDHATLAGPLTPQTCAAVASAIDDEHITRCLPLDVLGSVLTKLHCTAVFDFDGRGQFPDIVQFSCKELK